MKPFFNDYFNIAKMIKNKQEYRNQMKRVKKLPEDLQHSSESHTGKTDVTAPVSCVFSM